MDTERDLTTRLTTTPRIRVDGKYFARGDERIRLRGVTYGPFSPDSDGHPFPPFARIREDFTRMRELGVNAIRTYHVPPAHLLELAEDHDLSLLVDVPWSKHVCFLDDAGAQRGARQAIRDASRLAREYPSIFALSIGNEIPADILRWHGAAKVERFLRDLMGEAKAEAPDLLVTYANYPPGEYLDLSFLDFASFNVYLHDPEAFARYLYRLQHLAGEKPLLLSEIGMDTLRHGELEQARFLEGHLREAILLGVAGSFVFAWTDDWYTGGHAIQDWAFGVTDADRSPKLSYHALGESFSRSPAEQLDATPRVSVVVCSYNGASTLRQCLESLGKLDYPDYEVILVDDGSKDDTQEIAADFPEVRNIRQENRGLSYARNVGYRNATGSLVAYTDSDCFADPHWLSHLVHAMNRTDAAAVGGPNLTPEDGWLAGCIAASPGQPTHVMENEQVAEHIPGCNMMFRKEALETINGFDPEFRKAGDDVDVCWRLQHAGYWITFAPGAFVWHHRRQNPRLYLRQQMGYGEAEALLRFKHPDQFNGRGDWKWRGFIYGSAFSGLRLTQPIIYRGTSATGLFQCIYQAAPAHWAMLPGTLEWHGVAAVVALASILWSPAWMIALGMLGASLGLAALQAAQSHVQPEHDCFRSRLVVAAMCYVQPLARSWKRHLTRLSSFSATFDDLDLVSDVAWRFPLSGERLTEYWSEEWKDRTEVLDVVAGYLRERQIAVTVDAGWTDWDMEVYCHPWTAVQIRTVQEDHGSGKRLIRIQYRLRWTKAARLVGGLGILAFVVSVKLLPAVMVAGGVLGALGGVWWRSTALAYQVVKVVDALATHLKLERCRKPTKAAAKKGVRPWWKRWMKDSVV